jgi:hypothetical protein
MKFPPEIKLRLCRKALIDSRGDLNEAKAQAAGDDQDVLQAVERLTASLDDLLVRVDYQIGLLARRRA